MKNYTQYEINKILFKRTHYLTIAIISLSLAVILLAIINFV